MQTFPSAPPADGRNLLGNTELGTWHSLECPPPAELGHFSEVPPTPETFNNGLGRTVPYTSP